MTDERALQERFSELLGPSDGDWADVQRRARRRIGAPALAGAVAVVLAVAGLAVGGKVIGVFSVEGKKVPLKSLSARERELLVTSMCRHVALQVVKNRAPKKTCRDGNPTVEEIANNGTVAYYRIRYPWGVTCVASGPAGSRKIVSVGCNVGSPNQKLVPTPRRPITVDIQLFMSRDRSVPRLTRVSGLTGAGISKVELIGPDGSKAAADVRGRVYSFRTIPDRRWSAIVALDSSGHEVYRERLRLGPFPSAPVVRTPRVVFPAPPVRPAGRPLQHASTTVASADVYRNAVVAIRFASTASDAYRRLARGNGIDVGCGKVAYSAGRWEDLGGGSTARLEPEVRFRMDTVHGGMPSPPFDYCEISGMYGRYWNDEEGTHELVEVPFNALAKRFLVERATARDLAYLIRNKKMWPIRKAVQRGADAPTSARLAQIFGSRIEPLARRRAAPSPGRVGVWTGGRVIVASERAPDGRLLFVTVKGTLIGANNIRDLSYAF